MKASQASKRRPGHEEKGSFARHDDEGDFAPPVKPITEGSRNYSKGFARTFSGYASMWGGGPH